MIMEWHTAADGSRPEHRYYDVRSVSGICRTTVGVDYQVSRACEWVIDNSPGKVNRFFESVWSTWICIDRIDSDDPRVTVGAWFNIDFLTFYPRDQDPFRHDDRFTLRGMIMNEGECPFYDNNRDIFADRLLHKTHESWVRSWKLLEEVLGRPIKRWPVRLWVHQKPETVWEIDEQDRLVERPDLAPADEQMLQLFRPGTTPLMTPLELAAEDKEVEELIGELPHDQIQHLDKIFDKNHKNAPDSTRTPVPLPPWRT